MEELRVLTEATRMLAEAKTLKDIKKVLGKAQMAAAYAKAEKLGKEAQNHAAEIRLKAGRKAGELLVEAKKIGEISSGTGMKKKKSHTGISLSDLDITNQESSDWQTMAKASDELFEETLEYAKDKGVTSDRAVAELIRKPARKRERIAKLEELEASEFPAGKYSVIYADPPWQYGATGVTALGSYGGAEFHYETMSIEELCELPVASLAEDSCVLFIWVTSPLLKDVWSVIEAWGFEYKASFIWDKVKHNFGFYNSVRHELLLICGRGKATPTMKELKLHDSVVQVEREEHSTKPEYFRELIDELYPIGNRIELFARKKTKGWNVWGDEST